MHIDPLTAVSLYISVLLTLISFLRQRLPLSPTQRLSRPVKEGPFSRAIEEANAASVPTFAIDIPSGLSADAGQARFSMCSRV